MWREEGLQQGVQKGLEIGETQALAKAAKQWLTKKFYTVPKEVKEGISELDTITLERLIDDIWNAETVEDTKKYLQ